MHSSAKNKSPPFSLLFFRLCDKVYNKQKVRSFLLTSSYCHLTVITQIHWIELDNNGGVYNFVYNNGPNAFSTLFISILFLSYLLLFQKVYFSLVFVFYVYAMTPFNTSV